MTRKELLIAAARQCGRDNEWVPGQRNTPSPALEAILDAPDTTRLALIEQYLLESTEPFAIEWKHQIEKLEAGQ